MIKNAANWLIALIIFNLAFGVYALFNQFFLLYDDIEHLRAAYFVSLGYIPYQDFFEHHHPLLWYLWAPLMSVIPHITSVAIFIGRIVSYIISIGTGCFIYKIIKKTSDDKVTALIGICVLFWAVFTWPAMFNVKPDIYMRFCFYGGLYYLLKYFYEVKFKYLQISFLLFAIGFLFLQTIVMLCAPLIIPIGCYVYKNPQKIKDFLWASIFPFAIIVICATVLYYNNLLRYYFESNWIYNIELGKIMNYGWSSNYKFAFRAGILISEFLLLAVLSIVLFVREKYADIGYITIFSLVVCEFVQRFCFTSTYHHYLINLVILLSIIAAPAIKFLWQKNNIFVYFFIALSILHLMLNIFVPAKIDDKFRPHLYLEKYAANNDNIFGFKGGIFGRYYGYYWMYPNMERIDNIAFKRLPEYDVNEVIKQQKFDYIVERENNSSESILDLLTKSFGNTDETRQMFYNHSVNPEKLDDYDEIEPYFYRRKGI